MKVTRTVAIQVALDSEEAAALVESLRSIMQAHSAGCDTCLACRRVILLADAIAGQLPP